MQWKFLPLLDTTEDFAGETYPSTNKDKNLAEGRNAAFSFEYDGDRAVSYKGQIGVNNKTTIKDAACFKAGYEQQGSHVATSLDFIHIDVISKTIPSISFLEVYIKNAKMRNLHPGEGMTIPFGPQQWSQLPDMLQLSHPQYVEGQSELTVHVYMSETI